VPDGRDAGIRLQPAERAPDAGELVGPLPLQKEGVRWVVPDGVLRGLPVGGRLVQAKAARAEKRALVVAVDPVQLARVAVILGGVAVEPAIRRGGQLGRVLAGKARR
jgi:hypothetical protein